MQGNVQASRDELERPFADEKARRALGALSKAMLDNRQKSMKGIQWRKRKRPRADKTFGLSLRPKMCGTSGQCRDQSPRVG
jgi:hypothetical protein